MQLQTLKSGIVSTRLVDAPDLEPQEGEVRVRIDRFGYSANNVTYAAAGDTLGYWKFFPVAEAEWGVVPVWGFADVEVSRCDGIQVGERLFGYFPPASSLILEPINIAQGHFTDGISHRSEMPAGYNLYRRVEIREQDAEDRHMLLFPLYITSWCLWDALQQADWFGAKRVILASASSKTAIGTAFAINQDQTSPPILGLTSKRNLDFVTELELYDQALAYDDIESIDADIPTVIIDMSGDAAMLGRLHSHLGSNMKHTLDVGLTHWEAPRRDGSRDKERSTFFFAPSHIQARIKEWGAREFGDRTQEFIQVSTEHSKKWLEIDCLNGLGELGPIHTEIASGVSSPSAGFVIKV